MAWHKDDSRSFTKRDEDPKRDDKYIDEGWISNLDSEVNKLKKTENKIRIFNIWNKEEENEKEVNENGDIEDGYKMFFTVMSPLYFGFIYFIII